jgi:nuclear pore complex protein Nup133
MSLRQTSIFKARGNDDVGTSEKVASTDELVASSLLMELTKNNKYCVSKLPALPSVFGEVNDEFLNAYSDGESNYAIVVNQDSIHVWNYNSIDPTPLSIQFPIETSSALLPLAILTKPSSGTSKDPGIVIIDSSTGLVKFYESVQHAPALGLINNKLLQISLPINHGRGEYITLAQNVEPAGIAVATSWNRCVLISLRDFKGKPKLSLTELLKPKHLGSRLFSFFTSNNTPDYDSTNNDEIVCIRSGSVSSNGLTQTISILDAVGGFHYFTYQLVSSNGNAFIDKKRSFSQSFVPYIENNIDGFLPGSNLTVKFLDLTPIPKYDNIYLNLCHVEETFGNPQNKSLLLLTVKIDSTGVLTYGSHKLLTYTPNPAQSSKTKPRLFLPTPGNSAFVTVDNSIFITDIDTSYIDSKNQIEYYKPRWEDVVKLKSSVQIIGYGYENPSIHTNPAIVILTQNCGVLRVERFPDDEKIEADVSSDPLTRVKSHIDQAIFYASSSEIEFDLPQPHSNELIMEAIELTRNEILNSTSPYLSQFLPAINDSLSRKIELYHRLIKYCEKNFEDIWVYILPKLIQPLEKTEVALNFWNVITEDKVNSIEFKKILKQCINNSKDLKYEHDSDVIRKFFSQGVDHILPILTEFIEKLIVQNFSYDFITNLIVRTQYNGVYLNEKNHVIGKPILSTYKLWIFDTELLVRIEEIFLKDFCETDDRVTTLTHQRKIQLIQFVEVLYYYVTSAIMYMEQENNNQLSAYKSWYKREKLRWINALLKQHLSEDAIRIAEENHDFASVAQVLDAERKLLEDKHGEDSSMCQINEKYVYYFETHGYEFASALYSYYLKMNEIQPIILEFTNYKQYLYRYFQTNIEKASQISWIRYLLDEDVNAAYKSLLYPTMKHGQDNLDNQELRYSLAKLSAIAAQGSQDIVDETENNLIHIRIQKQLYQSILKIYGNKELISLAKLEALRNEKIDHVQAGVLFKQSFDNFQSNRPVTHNQLINLLTLLKPTILGTNAFSNALQIASIMPNEKQFHYYCKVIWLRLLTVGDDWSIIKTLNTMTDSSIKQKIHETYLYKTLVEINDDKIMLKSLDELLTSKTIIETEADVPTKTINRDLLQKLRELNKEYDIQPWVESIRDEAKLSK